MKAGAVKLKLEDRVYVVVPSDEYRRLKRIVRGLTWPRMPKPDVDGSFPAVEAALASIARSIVRDRLKAGLTQGELARLAGIRTETVCRLETGRHTPTLRTVEKIDRALKRARDRSERPSRPSGSLPQTLRRRMSG